MRDIRLTCRGRIVVSIMIVLAVVVLYAIFYNMTMPQECRVGIQEMSQRCQMLL